MAKILLVEDDDMIRKMLDLRLSMKGHQVETRENGKLGYEEALANDYDAVLMDMHMPVMDGHEAASTLRNEGYKGLIIAVTASVMAQDTDSAIQSGCNFFIAKPVGADFEQQVETYIESFASV